MKARSPEPGPVVTDRIIRLAIKVHRRLGPGLLETVYHQCLCWELQHDGIAFETEVPLPIIYLDCVKNCKKVNLINDLWKSTVREKTSQFQCFRQKLTQQDYEDVRIDKGFRADIIVDRNCGSDCPA